MKLLEDLLYSESHEWVKVEDGKVYIGLTDYAQLHLGEIVFVDLPEVGSSINAEEQIAEVESVKSVSEVYSPVSGTITEINEELLDNPGAINKDAYGSYLVAAELHDPAELEKLLSAQEYRKLCEALCGEESH